MIDPRVYSICEEYGLRIVDGRSYPGIRETRAVVTMDKILKAKGEDHFRMVLSTVAETENNQGYIDKHLLWAVSDLIMTWHSIVEAHPMEWLDCFDAAPVAELQYIAKRLPHQRFALVGMLSERVIRKFGPNALQGDLFDDRRRAA
ncbi:hypothetical protein U8C35_07730 [Sinorhizobium medicae]|uniref:hypothetical protein n=1 Tax=Sinorhizobium medicae TaxID=110321 RepID=UPI002AF6A6F5|nr:hypothetical protein [Sinorhizobium medicae]WQO60301.1 hypothetical protein U8C35_07730 [Sinorhizobium medicae]